VHHYCFNFHINYVINKKESLVNGEQVDPGLENPGARSVVIPAMKQCDPTLAIALFY
jgi:hypothetical protein